MESCRDLADGSDENVNKHRGIPSALSRKKTLGFQPQRELIYNHLLPYACQLDKESEAHWKEIKVNMSLSVVLRDPKIGGLHWLSQLSKYIRMYSFKFSLDDHLQMVQLLYQVIQTPGLEYSLIQKYATSLSQLLRKRELIQRKQLKLQWRPLYRLLLGLVDSNHESYGLVSHPDNIENVIKTLIRMCRIYFPVESTSEMLQEWRPMLCPFDTKMAEAMSYFELFLPTLVYPEEHQQTFKLWLQEFMIIYNNSCSNPVYESSLVSLLSRLARDNIGYVDWDDHLDVIFTRILASFNLPVGSDKVKIGKGMDNYSINNCSRWIVAMLSPNNSTLHHTTCLFQALNSYYHPSNHGSWTSKLLKLPKRLAIDFVTRLEREKYKPTDFSELDKDEIGGWEPMIPQECRSSDDLIDKFVNLVISPLLSSMFSKAGSGEAMMTFKCLSSLRPELVIPPLLQSTYSSLETLTEPHRLISCLQCTTAVMSNMVLYSDRYPQGRSHVIPILSLCLPGIDPNDLNKSMMTFRLISILTLLVPLVDCSQARNYYYDLTPMEEELCAATAQFEDIVLQFFDRVISLIDTSTHQHTRTDSNDATTMSHEEKIYEMSLYYTSKAVLKQSSKPIFMEALKKIQTLALGSVYEHKVSGRFVTKVIKAAVKVRPEVVLEKFVPHCASLVISRLTNEDLNKEEHLDSELLWHLQMLSELFCCNGTDILPYQDQITQVLDLTLSLKCKASLQFGNTLLRNILKSLTCIYILNSYSFDLSVDTPIQEFLPVRFWGRVSSLKTLQPVWHEPDPHQLNLASLLLHRYLTPRLHNINSFSAAEMFFEREDLLKLLNVVSTCMEGVATVLPDWTQQQQGGAIPLSLVEAAVPIHKLALITNQSNKGLQLDGQNIRLLISDHATKLLKYLLEHAEDDTKSLIMIIHILVETMNRYSHMKEDFKRTWSDGKSYMQNKLLGKKRHIRQILVKRLQLQHELRASSQSTRSFTQCHFHMYQHLFSLATSHYMQVRKTAQTGLNKCFRHYIFSYRSLIPQICHNLYGIKMDGGGPVETHEFKGTLYLIIGENKSSLMCKRNWNIANQLWPAVIKSPLYTTPSLVNLHNRIIDKLLRDFESNEIHIKVSGKAEMVAQEILKDEGLALSDDELKIAKQKELLMNQTREKEYLKLVDTLCDIINTAQVSWKFLLTCHDLLSLMTRNDIKLPIKPLHIFLSALKSPQLTLRRMGIVTVCGVLQQLKRSRCLEVVNLNCKTLPYRQVNQNTNKNNDNTNNSNNWLIYDESKIPKTAEEFDRYIFIDKTFHGYYTWPKYITCHRSSMHQPKQDRIRDELMEIERPIYDFFSDRKSVQEFIDLLTIGDDKEKNRISIKNFLFFKGLFRNYDTAFMPLLLEQANRLVDKEDHVNREANQRCASEIVGGLMRGSKHWSFEMRERMWTGVIEILGKVTSILSVESTKNWAAVVIYTSEDQDPTRLHQLFKFLTENPLSGIGGAFGDSSRLFMLECGLVQQEWRLGSFSKRLASFLIDHFDHPYKNVRDIIASLLVNINLFDVRVHPSIHPTSHPPHLQHFFTTITQHLSPLLPLTNKSLRSVISHDDFPEVELHFTKADNKVALVKKPTKVSSYVLNKMQKVTLQQQQKQQDDDGEEEEDENHKRLLRILKTVLKMIQGLQLKLLNLQQPQLLSLLPLIAAYEGDVTDADLSRECSVTMVTIAVTVLNKPHIDNEDNMINNLVAAIKKTSETCSWKGRVAILTFTQRWIFKNIFLLINNNNGGVGGGSGGGGSGGSSGGSGGGSGGETVKALKDILFFMLSDKNIEVRELAGVTISGLFQCGFLQVDDSITKYFKKLAATKITKMKRPQPPATPTIPATPASSTTPASPTTPTKSEIPQDEAIILRHTGVIGLCACVNAHPYDVPSFLPSVLMILINHLHDPQPIQLTVKRSLTDFKRTHLDNWQELKSNFTDNQLVVLTELLVSPNYYA